MLTRIVTAALFGGALAGLLAGVLQLALVQPVLLHAELYETGQRVHFGVAAAAGPPVLPGIDVVRDGLTLVFTLFLYCGYGLVLAALIAAADTLGVVTDARRGLIWGLAGFVAVMLAPAVSLPPEVPGSAAADLAARQVWWCATVGAAGVAMALMAFGRGVAAWLGAAALLVAPHLIGAPAPPALAGPVPPELAALFATRALGVGLAAWAMLGLCVGHVWQREAVPAPRPALSA